MEFRNAVREDVPLILAFIKELAAYEKMTKDVTATEALLERTLFDEKHAQVFFALVDGQEVGFALFFHNFSTFLGKPGLYLEDLYIQPKFRGQGIGKAMFKKLAQLAVTRNCGRMEWSCLNWNQPSIDFYLSLEAQPMDEWMVYRLTEEALTKLAE